MMSFDKKINLKKHIWRRFLIFTLCFCILFAAYPAFVSAQEGDSVSSSGIEPNADMSGNTGRQSQDEAAWTDPNAPNGLLFGSFLEAIANVGDGETVILRSDISLTEEIAISKSMTITSWYADAPCTIKRTAADTEDEENRGTIFTVGRCQLILQNIILDGGKNEGVTAYHPMICVTDGGFLVMLEGAVLQNAENKDLTLCGGGVNVRSGQFYMYDGSVITGCKARLGGGVEVNSSSNTGGAMFGMAGGSINNCSADGGGGVYVNIGMFQIRGGEITGNRALSDDDAYGGGGIYAAGGSGSNKIGAVLVAGGKITGNTAQSCGGGAMLNGTYSQIQMTGGIIENNNAINGGGVYIHRGMLALYGGTITRNVAELYGGGVLNSPFGLVKLKGNPKVFENIGKDKEDHFDNLYLDGEVGGLPASPVWIVGPLTDGINIGMSLWVRPDEKDHPYWSMIIPNGYTLTQSDLDKLCYDRSAENKGMYADNMEKFGFIMHGGEIVMVLDVDISLDREYLAFEGINDPPVSLTATVTPANAPEKGVTWSSSDENVATVDENGKVTPVGGGRAVITATTKAPYHATASCNVTVSYYQLETKAEHGTLTYTPVEPNEFFPGGELVKLHVAADRGYRLNSLRAYYTDEESTEVVISDDDTLVMPNHYVTVEAVFKPIPYKINCDLSEGALNWNETNPDSYTIENDEITLNNPTRNGYTFVGWTGTELSSPTLVVKIPTGSIGDREYRAVWEKANGGKPTDNEDTHHENSAPSYNNSAPSDNNSELPDNDTSLTINENEPIPSESKPTYNDYNPPTGSAISFVSLTAITVIAAVVRKRK